MGETGTEVAALPVRILFVSEGHRSRARIPGMLALCKPCAKRRTSDRTTAKQEEPLKAGRDPNKELWVQTP